MGRKIFILLIGYSLVVAGCGVIEEDGEIAAFTPSPVPVEDLSGEDVLQFNISFDKPAYHLEERILLKMELSNNGKLPVMVLTNLIVIPSYHAFTDFYVYLNITKPSNGKILPLILPNLPYPDEYDFKIFHPREKFTVFQNIDRALIFDEVGVYTVQAVYNNSLDHPDGRPAWKGQVFLNTVQFEIIAEAP